MCVCVSRRWLWWLYLMIFIKIYRSGIARKSFSSSITEITLWPTDFPILTHSILQGHFWPQINFFNSLLKVLLYTLTCCFDCYLFRTRIEFYEYVALMPVWKMGKTFFSSQDKKGQFSHVSNVVVKKYRFDKLYAPDFLCTFMFTTWPLNDATVRQHI